MPSVGDNYWTRSSSELLVELDSSENGLSTRSVEERLTHRQPPRKRSRFSKEAKLLLGQFKSPIIILLLFAAVLSLILRQHVDSLIILAILLISGILGFVQERSANIAIEKLLAVVKPTCSVLRNGVVCQVAPSQIVSGDIISIVAGASVPADSIIIDSNELFLDEATLTGESYPVEKHVGILSAETPLNSRTNCVFEGTHVISGAAKVLAIETGANTHLGKLSEHVGRKSPENDFERGIKSFGYFLLEVTTLLVLAIFAINVFLHRPVLDSIMFSLALAVGLTPQLLPAIVSINLAVGARRMAQAKCIVKRLSAIESFGSMNVLCSDKTGTLTEGTVQIQATIDIADEHSEHVRKLAYLNSTLETGFPNPIDEALRQEIGIEVSGYSKSDEIPYDFNRKRLTLLVRDSNGSYQMISKGALESILSICSDVKLGSAFVPLASVRDQIAALMSKKSEQGYRVLGVAYRTVKKSQIRKEDEQNMTLAGLLVIVDPPKSNISETIKQLSKLGVRLKVITGDNALVARAVALKVGIENPKVMSASDLHHVKTEALPQLVNTVDVFAEVEPNQKEQIILALKRAGNVVGYLGDGINDAPALHVADVGISVSNAVDVARDTAQIVMLEHDLSVLIEGVIEGRRTFINTQKYIFMATSANFGNMASMAGASVFLPFLPLLPKQILLLNLLTDIPEMTIATDSVDEELLMRPCRWNIQFIRSFMLFFGTLSALFDCITFVVLLYILDANVQQFRSGWFVESVVSASLVVLIIRTHRPVYSSRPSRPLFVATMVIGVCALTIPFSPIAHFFGFIRLKAEFYFALMGILTLYMISAEMLKAGFYKSMTHVGYKS